MQADQNFGENINAQTFASEEIKAHFDFFKVKVNPNVILFGRNEKRGQKSKQFGHIGVTDLQRSEAIQQIVNALSLAESTQWYEIGLKGFRPPADLMFFPDEYSHFGLQLAMFVQGVQTIVCGDYAIAWIVGSTYAKLIIKGAANFVKVVQDIIDGEGQFQYLGTTLKVNDAEYLIDHLCGVKFEYFLETQGINPPSMMVVEANENYDFGTFVYNEDKNCPEQSPQGDPLVVSVANFHIQDLHLPEIAIGSKPYLVGQNNEGQNVGLYYDQVFVETKNNSLSDWAANL